MRIVMVFGTFDILHPGHIHFLRQAKKHGDMLIAVVGRDVNVERIKSARPYYDERERKNMLSELRLVDQALLGHKTDPLALIKKIKPHVIALGYDQVVYVDRLKDLDLVASGKTKVVRLKAFQDDKHKSHHIKAHLHKTI